jgi:hypothetical protein
MRFWRRTGRHTPSCRWHQRRQRRTRAAGRRLVDDIEQLYVGQRRRALSTAGRIGGFGSAMDALHDAVVFMLGRAPGLRGPLEPYFMTCVRKAAIGRRQ